MASIFSRFFGRTVSEAAGFAAGVATGPVLAPVVEDVRLATWEAHPVKRVDAEVAAAIVAEDVELRDWGAHEAAGHGFNGDRFDALLGEALNAPGIPQLFETWRRNLIDDAAFEHGLRKAKLEPQWDAPLRGLKERLLSLDQLANARQQGFIDAARQHEEAALQGQDTERADISFELSGLPLGVESMQDAINRGLVDRATFDQAIREGHTKTKYTDLAFALRQPILSAQTYATLHLKGWIDAAAMNAGGALHGYTPEQMNDLYLSMGRPASPGYMWTAAARGIDGPDGRPVDQAQFQKAIAESDIRPEYGPMLWAIRYTYPPLFQINRLVQGGAIDAATATEWARKDRLAPEVVAALETYWQGGGTATTDTHVTKAQTQLWGRTHTSYLAGEISETDARAALAVAGVTAAALDDVLAVWNHERELERKQLTPAQVKKAYAKGVTNQATGATWTRDDALAALIGRGYSTADANTFLDL
jgi:hypothetical protein